MSELKKAERLYREFNGKKPSEIVEIPEVRFPELVHIGKADLIGYLSGKEGKPTYYKHDFGEESGELPDLYTDPDGKVLIITGGNFKIKKRPGDKVAWIID